MRAMLLLVLLLALIALFSFHEPLRPFWESRLPAVVACLDEGRYHDAWEAATAGTPPGEDSPYWKKSEPLGEVAAAEGVAPADQVVPAEGVAPADQAVPEEELLPVEKTEPADEANSGM